MAPSGTLGTQGLTGNKLHTAEDMASNLAMYTAEQMACYHKRYLADKCTRASTAKWQHATAGHNEPKSYATLPEAAIQ